MFIAVMGSAQVIKDSFGKPYTTDEKTIKVIADPAKRKPGFRSGFYVEFDFRYGMEINQKESFMTQIEKIVIRKELGYFNQYYSEKAGTYYPCSKLENLCENIELIGINIEATWEYNGQQYKTGAITMVNRINDKSYLRKPIGINRPGGSVIPIDAVKSGAAKVINIEVVSWSVNNTYPIMRIVNKLYEEKKK